MKCRFQIYYAVNFQSLTPEAWIQFQVYPYENCGGQGGTGLFSLHVFCLSMSVLLQQSLKFTFKRRTYVKKPENFQTKRSAFFISEKVKSILEQATKATLSLISALDGSEWLTRRPGRFTLGMTRYPFYRRLGEPQGRSGCVPKILLPSGFDPRTVQPVSSRYTDYAVPAQISGGY